MKRLALCLKHCCPIELLRLSGAVPWVLLPTCYEDVLIFVRCQRKCPGLLFLVCHKAGIDCLSYRVYVELQYCLIPSLEESIELAHRLDELALVNVLLATSKLQNALFAVIVCHERI